MSEPRLQLLPAVDVVDGQAVRLVQGEAGSETGYGDALDAALAWQQAGAEWVHLVDLDAAFGRGSNAVLLADVANSRRTAFLVLGVGFFVMLLLAYIRLPARRTVIRRLVLAIGVFSCFYLPAYWNKTGTIGQPVALSRAMGRSVMPTACPVPTWSGVMVFR